MKIGTTATLLLVIVSVFGVANAFPAPILKATASSISLAGGPLPTGTKVYFALGGDGCNCPGFGTTGTINSSGEAIVEINLLGCHPNEKCLVFARAESGGKPYKGSNKVFTGAGGYYSSFSIAPA